MTLNNRIIIQTESLNGVHNVRGFVDNKEVISVNNRILTSWGVGSSTTLPYGFEQSLLYIECYTAVMNHAKSLQALIRGVRVQVNSKSGFNVGAKGIVEFVEPNDGRVWVLRDGSSSPVFFNPYELDII